MKSNAKNNGNNEKHGLKYNHRMRRASEKTSPLAATKDPPMSSGVRTRRNLRLGFKPSPIWRGEATKKRKAVPLCTLN
jgi:hypothetical protein